MYSMQETIFEDKKGCRGCGSHKSEAFHYLSLFKRHNASLKEGQVR